MESHDRVRPEGALPQDGRGQLPAPPYVSADEEYHERGDVERHVVTSPDAGWPATPPPGQPAVRNEAAARIEWPRRWFYSLRWHPLSSSSTATSGHQERSQTMQTMGKQLLGVAAPIAGALVQQLPNILATLGTQLAGLNQAQAVSLTQNLGGEARQLAHQCAAVAKLLAPASIPPDQRPGQRTSPPAPPSARVLQRAHVLLGDVANGITAAHTWFEQQISAANPSFERRFSFMTTSGRLAAVRTPDTTPALGTKQRERLAVRLRELAARGQTELETIAMEIENHGLRSVAPAPGPQSGPLVSGLVVSADEVTGAEPPQSTERPPLQPQYLALAQAIRQLQLLADDMHAEHQQIAAQLSARRTWLRRLTDR